MRLKHIKGSEEIVSSSIYVIKNPTNYIGKWNTVFNNNNKIYLEIGSGKGKFIYEKAKKHKNINFIAFEKYPSVLLNLIKELERDNLNNLKIICADAQNIDQIFNKEIRLTSSVFLNKYDKVFKGIKVIEQKTDNDDLFNYSIESFKAHRYFIIKKNTNYFDKIKTEYEEKFIRKGKNINYVKVIKF